MEDGLDVRRVYAEGDPSEVQVENGSGRKQLNPCGRKRMRGLGGSGAEATARIMVIYHLMWILFPHHVRLTGMIVIYLSLCLSYASRRIENR